MKPSIGLAALVAAGIVLSASAASAGHARPGLWNSLMTVTVENQNATGVPAMPAMGGKPPAPVPTKVCLTPEMAAADTPPKRPGCIYQNIKLQGSRGTGSFVCKGIMSGSGNFTVTYTSDKHYEGTTTFASEPVQGKSMKAKTTFSGTWLSADCGAVKPVP